MRSDLLLLVLVVALVPSTLAYVARRKGGGGGGGGTSGMGGFEDGSGSGMGMEGGFGSEFGGVFGSEDGDKRGPCKPPPHPKPADDGSVKRRLNWFARRMQDGQDRQECTDHLEAACWNFESTSDNPNYEECEHVADLCMKHLMKGSGDKRSEDDSPTEEEKDMVCGMLNDFEDQWVDAYFEGDDKRILGRRSGAAKRRLNRFH